MGFKNRIQLKKAIQSPKVGAAILPIAQEGKIDSLLGRIACFVSGEHIPATVICKDGGEVFLCVSCWEVFDVERDET